MTPAKLYVPHLLDLCIFNLEAEPRNSNAVHHVYFDNLNSSNFAGTASAKLEKRLEAA